MTRYSSLRTAAIAGLVVVAMVVAIPAGAMAGQTVQSSKQVTDSVTIKATIVSIDKATRMVTLRGPKGNDVTLHADENVTRFDQLKVGDQITAIYSESLAVSVRKPGAAAPEKEKQSIVRAEGQLAAKATREQSISVSVQAIDLATSHLTVKGPEGNTLSFKVQDKDQLRGLKVGDKVDVTYTEALLMKADSAK
jgi:Cu/Ag efflux protein CusF